MVHSGYFCCIQHILLMCYLLSVEFSSTKFRSTQMQRPFNFLFSIFKCLPFSKYSNDIHSLHSSLLVKESIASNNHFFLSIKCVNKISTGMLVFNFEMFVFWVCVCVCMSTFEGVKKYFVVDAAVIISCIRRNKLPHEMNFSAINLYMSRRFHIRIRVVIIVNFFNYNSLAKLLWLCFHSANCDVSVRWYYYNIEYIVQPV